jgi:hypothetical protein
MIFNILEVFHHVIALFTFAEGFSFYDWRLRHACVQRKFFTDRGNQFQQMKLCFISSHWMQSRAFHERRHRAGDIPALNSIGSLFESRIGSLCY